jgi:hypothetical protein
MDIMLTSDRTDEQLEAILCETANWSVQGRGQILCVAASLQTAIQRAGEYSLSDAVVTGISRLPMGDILLLPPQINRLRRNLIPMPISGDQVACTRKAAEEPPAC